MIFYSDAGNGPITASKALAEALTNLQDRYEVSTIDILKHTNRVGYLMVNLYNYFLAKNLIWNAFGLQIFYRSYLIKSGALLSFFSLKLLIDMLEKEKPTAIILTNPWIVGYVIRAIRKIQWKRKPKIISMVIDIGPNLPPGWFMKDIDLYIVPTDEARRELIEFGAYEENVKALGMPVYSKFLGIQLPERGSNGEFNECYYCKECTGRSKILIMGGRSGTRNTFQVFRHLMESCIPSLHLTILCGRNKSLKYKIEKYLSINTKSRGHLSIAEAADNNTKHVVVRGFEPDIYPYLLTTDLVITKPGALTISEAVSIGTPLILDTYPVVMGQEVGNVKFVESRGLGLVARKPKDIPLLVNTILNNKELRQRLLSSTWNTSNNMAGTSRITNVILETIDKHVES
jgi:processive 1,2-diacylglycerol beta-glucosyltransferase